MTYVEPRQDALVFTGPNGATFRRGNLNPLSRWADAVASIGAPGLHFHNLRHTGNHLAARTGATTKDLMTRVGHDDMRAALIYQHATDEADRQIAERLSNLVEAHRPHTRLDDDGAAGAAGASMPAS